MVREVRSSKRLQTRKPERPIRQSIHKTPTIQKKGIKLAKAGNVVVTKKKSATKPIIETKKITKTRKNETKTLVKRPSIGSGSKSRQKSEENSKNMKKEQKIKKEPSSKKSAKTPRLTKKVLSAYEEETRGIRPIDRGSSWDGNSDSLGSVNSGVLDENLCFICGIETTDDDYEKVVLCDCCDGEYHLSCVGLSGLPRISWTCSLCRDERMWFSKLKYDVPNFKVRFHFNKRLRYS